MTVGGNGRVSEAAVERTPPLPANVAGCVSTAVRNLRFRESGITVRATLLSDYVDPRINGGLALRRTYTFRVQPRNLIYERNRDN